MAEKETKTTTTVTGETRESITIPEGTTVIMGETRYLGTVEADAEIITQIKGALYGSSTDA